MEIIIGGLEIYFMVVQCLGATGSEDEVGKPRNKGQMYISETSPMSVIDAYWEQFSGDFTLFLESRAEEVGVWC